MTVQALPNSFDYAICGEPYVLLAGIASNTSLQYARDGELYRGIEPVGSQPLLTSTAGMGLVAVVAASAALSANTSVSVTQAIKITIVTRSVTGITLNSATPAWAELHATGGIVVGVRLLVDGLVIPTTAETYAGDIAISAGLGEGYEIYLGSDTTLHGIPGVGVADPALTATVGLVAIGAMAVQGDAVLAAAAFMAGAPMFTRWGDKLRAQPVL